MDNDSVTVSSSPSSLPNVSFSQVVFCTMPGDPVVYLGNANAQKFILPPGVPVMINPAAVGATMSLASVYARTDSGSATLSYGGI
jgi:hypothetical protein